MPDTRQWRPGSFTKNYSWGLARSGLSELHRAINVGFAGELRDTPRRQFRQRIAADGRPDFIPINFFLFNRPIGGVDHVVVDELVFQAVTSPHGPSFDKLAIFALNLSLVGTWKGGKVYQRYPSLWAQYYVIDRVNHAFDWDAGLVSADDIQRFVTSDPRYTGRTGRKLATNLNYLYAVGRLREYSTELVERWWVDCLFLAMDRVIEDRRLDGANPGEGVYPRLLAESHFAQLSGRRSLAKELAMRHLIALYTACGGRERFVDDAVRQITSLRLPDVEWLLANDTRPQGAVHPTNPNILKTIPRACALLAKYAGFEVIDAEDLATFDPAEFVRRRTRHALQTLQDKRIVPMMSADEVTEITRER